MTTRRINPATQNRVETRCDSRAKGAAPQCTRAIHECCADATELLRKYNSDRAGDAHEPGIGQSPIAALDYSDCSDANGSQQVTQSDINQSLASLHNEHYAPASCRVIRLSHGIVRLLERLAFWLTAGRGGGLRQDGVADGASRYARPHIPPGVFPFFRWVVKGTLG